MTIKEEEVQQYPLDIEFKGNTKLFDLDTLS